VVDVSGLLPEPSGCLSSSRPPVRASRVLASRAANSELLQRHLREAGFMLVRAQTGPVREATLQRLLEQTRKAASADLLDASAQRRELLQLAQAPP